MLQDPVLPPTTNTWKPVVDPDLRQDDVSRVVPCPALCCNRLEDRLTV